MIALTIIGVIIVVLLLIANINIARLNNNVIEIAKVYARYIDRKEEKR